MNKKEISEIKKQFTPSHCAITRICGCYVDGEKEKKTQIQERFLTLPEEEMFKYFDIFRKTLSGTLGKNLVNMEFPAESEDYGGTQAFLMSLKESQLSDPNLLNEFYDKVITSYDYGENYLILLIHSAYDVPGKSTDGLEMEDASDEVYEHILCAICPVKLSKPGLSYQAELNEFHDRIRDWIVEMPEIGFLFPAFNDRSTDIHNILYYTKDAEDLRSGFVDEVLGCVLPMTAKNQKEIFHTLIEDTLGTDCSFDAVKNIHDSLYDIIEEKKEEPDPVLFDKTDIKNLLANSGVETEKLENFEKSYEETTVSPAPMMASNIANTRKFEVKTPDVTIQVNPGRSDLVETKIIDGRPCLVIAINDAVEVNGIPVRIPLPETEASDDNEKEDF
ncbi:DUF4317 domain-containing protein [Frisingicoccus sp.]|uniref:DUF4317 domain-containing protein n=1 Tax=Frisingicoccus sp. TaxID=1918627 RepID=UPI002A823AE5|nr:DUF4317 domain-containing protein [Frisingicoccus sp.]MDY4833870.1 DUF4317 domain-containing protein [Frisingicoccus sp.]MDY4922021.1 DUF4317 domain-containing protein [Frisingicoccus sp.]